MEGLGWIEVASQLSFGALLVYIIVIHNPKRDEVHRTERDVWLKIMIEQLEKCHLDSQRTSASISELAQAIRDMSHDRRSHRGHEAEDERG